MQNYHIAVEKELFGICFCQLWAHYITTPMGTATSEPNI